MFQLVALVLMKYGIAEASDAALRARMENFILMI